MSTSLILPALYLPPVSYFHAIQQDNIPILLDKHEHYVKQSYRSRTRLATANGILDLFIPIAHGRKIQVPMQDIRISYDHNWQRLHWLSIQTAYRSSAYFEYYESDFARFYENKFDFLYDFNKEQLALLLKCIKVSRDIQESSSYIETAPEEIDFRSGIHPKKPSLYTKQKPYYQVFQDITGFTHKVRRVKISYSIFIFGIKNNMRICKFYRQY